MRSCWWLLRSLGVRMQVTNASALPRMQEALEALLCSCLPVLITCKVSRRSVYCTGTLPWQWCELPLHYLAVYHNQLTGARWCAHFLHALQCGVSACTTPCYVGRVPAGTLPTAYANMSALEMLMIGRNRLSGEQAPCCDACLSSFASRWSLQATALAAGVEWLLALFRECPARRNKIMLEILNGVLPHATN